MRRRAKEKEIKSKRRRRRRRETDIANNDYGEKKTKQNGKWEE